MSGKIVSKLDIICCRGIQGKDNAFLGWMLHNRLHRLGDYLIKDGKHRLLLAGNGRED